MAAIGERINASAESISPDLIASFANAAVAVISDNMSRLYGTRALRPFHRSGRMVGTAVTVKTRPGDNKTIHKAYEFLRPGDVLVVDGAGDTNQALVGEIMMNRARAMGVAGFVIDGAIRDVAAFEQAQFPCYARSVTHRGPYKNGPGEINVPVSIDGMVVMPGDLVIADEDGVVAFDRAYGHDILALVKAQEAREANALADIAAGRLDRPYTAIPENKA